jgi:bifunctional non-homologous end joining protein LigD
VRSQDRFAKPPIHAYLLHMVLLREHRRTRPGFIEPCLPTLAKKPPSGPDWIHEIKHDGYRIMARRDSGGVRLITRNGRDFSARFPFMAMAVNALSAKSCLIDGEAIITDDKGLAVFDLLRRGKTNAAAVFCAFDLIEFNGEDLRDLPIERRKRMLAKLLKGAHSSIALNEHFEAEGDLVFEAACRLGCEGIVSKRLGSRYRSGRSDSWVKIKNPAAPAGRREAEEDWGS